MQKMLVRLHLTNKEHQVDDIQTSTSFQVLGGMRKLISPKKNICAGVDVSIYVNSTQMSFLGKFFVPTVGP